MMLLTLIAGDDEHTGAEPAYTRILKIRKWLYIFAVLLVAAKLPATQGLVKTAIDLSSLPRSWLPSIFFGLLLYFTTQYLFVAWQLIVSYPFVLKERLGDQQSEQIEAAEAKLHAARKKEQDYVVRKVPNHLIVAASETWDRMLGEADRNDNPKSGLSTYADVSRQGDIVKELKADPANSPMPSPKSGPEWDAIQSEIQRTSDELRTIAAFAPADRPGYRKAETYIDILRLVSPIVAVIAAMTFPAWL